LELRSSRAVQKTDSSPAPAKSGCHFEAVVILIMQAREKNLLLVAAPSGTVILQDSDSWLLCGDNGKWQLEMFLPFLL